MNTWKSYLQGVKDALRPKMVFVLWVVNFLFGSILYFLISGFLSESLSWSTQAKTLMKKGDFNVLLDILIHHKGEVSTLLAVGILLLFFYYLISLFLKGGVLFSLSESIDSIPAEKKERFASHFFKGAGRFFGRFFRLLIYSLIFWAGFILVNVLFNLLVGILTDRGSNEKMFFIMFWVRVAVFIFFYFFILMVLDYARIKIVLENSREVFKTMFWALGFVLKKLGRTLALYYILVATGVLIAAVYWLIDSVIPGQTLIMVFLAFMVGQIFILARSWLTITFQAAQMRFLLAVSKRPDTNLPIEGI